MKGRIYLNVKMNYPDAMQIAADLGKRLPTLEEAKEINPAYAPGVFWTSTGDVNNPDVKKDSNGSNRNKVLTGLNILLKDWE